MADGTRTCTKCKRTLPETEFWKDAHHTDGWFRWCKDCCREKQRKWKAANPEKVKKQADDFRAKNPEKVRRWLHDCYLRNPEKYNEASRERYWLDPQEAKDKQFAARLWRDYRLSVEDYYGMLEVQGYLCAICRKPSEAQRRLAVDHDHRPDGNVRGLLCGPCNFVLGAVDDDVLVLGRAIRYLQAAEDLVSKESN